MPRTRTIDDNKWMNDVIKRCDVCYVAMVDENNLPYVLPYNFGFRDGIIYLHSAREGKKMDILRMHPDICIAFSTDHELRFTTESVACSYGMKYRSVVVNGKIEFIEDFDAKIEVLNIIMEKYTGKTFQYNAPSIHEVCIYKVNIAKMTGREHAYS